MSVTASSSGRRRAVSFDDFRAVMASVCGHVAVATTMVDDRPHGTTVTTFTAQSLDPPLVSISLNRDSLLLARLRVSARFGVNLLAHDQEHVALRCSGKEADKLDTINWYETDGLPQIAGAAGWVSCDIIDEIPVGDHILIIGHVFAVGVGAQPSAPLVYAHRTFGTHSGWAATPLRQPA